jgi:DNA mismatch repair protein MutL
MPKIKLLDEETVNKIAAGEVIERPASVVKELVENSIDAGATRILIDVEDGGKGLIRVSDDGCGMDPEDLGLAFQKHATSKIRDAKDLNQIATLGFRGEALSSISSVSGSVEVQTKTSSALTGSFMRLEKGRVVETKEIGCPAGTTIAVRGLFQNVPARLKYLKSAGSELAHITDAIQEMAIINYGISFELFSGRRSLFKSNRAASWEGCLLRIVGLEAVRDMVPFQSESKSFKIEGSVASQLHSRSSPDWIFSYVNGRPVYSKMVVGALREAFRGLIPSGRSPIAVVSLEIDPWMIDVNVHPTKREIRFLREEELSEALRKAVSEAIQSRKNVLEARPYGVRPSTPEQISRIRSADAQRTLPLDAVSPMEAVATLVRPDQKPDHLPAQAPTSSQAPEDGPEHPRHQDKRSLNVLGQVLKLYIVAEGERGLVLVDQHAAAERIRYERLVERYRQERISQELVEPVNIDLSPKEQVLLDSWMEALEDVGFKISHFGGSTYNVRAVPALGYRVESPEVVHDILRDLFASGKVESESTGREDILKLLACRGSIKSGHQMSLSEMKALLEELMECQNPETCPHGRPVIALLDEVQLEKIFQRR